MIQITKLAAYCNVTAHKWHSDDNLRLGLIPQSKQQYICWVLNFINSSIVWWLLYLLIVLPCPKTWPLMMVRLGYLNLSCTTFFILYIYLFFIIGKSVTIFWILLGRYTIYVWNLLFFIFFELKLEIFWNYLEFTLNWDITIPKYKTIILILFH